MPRVINGILRQTNLPDESEEYLVNAKNCASPKLI